MKKYYPFTVFLYVAIAGMMVTNVAIAQVPDRISYQGVIRNSLGQPENGIININFGIYDQPNGGVALWEEGHGGVIVEDGLFSVILGSVNITQTKLRDLPFDRPYWLEITIDGSPPITPRAQLTSAAYAMRAHTVETISIKPGMITPENMNDNGTDPGDGQVLAFDAGTGAFKWVNPASGGGGAIGQVTAGDGITVVGGTGPIVSVSIADNGVTSRMLEDKAVGPRKIGDLAVGTNQIANGAVTQEKLNDNVSFPLSGNAGGVLAGKYPNPGFAEESVTNLAMKPNAITADKVKDSTLTGADINSSANLAIKSMTTSDNVAIGTTKSGARLIIKGKGKTSATSALHVTDNADGSLLYVGDDGSIGVGTSAPTAAMEIASTGVSLKVSSGGTAFSYVSLPAGPAITIPPNTSVVQIMNDNASTINSITMPLIGTPGQILIICNDDLQPTSGGAVVPSGQARMYVYLPFPLLGVWRRLN